MQKVTVYTVPNCFDCAAAKNLLKEAGIDFEEVDVSEIEHSREALEMLTGVRSLPQVFVDGTFIGQVAETRYLLQSGRLDRLLENAARVREER